MATITEQGDLGLEEGVLVRVFGVGMEDDRKPGAAGKTAEQRTNYFAPIPVWDPVKGEAVFPKAPPVYANEAERQVEERIAARVRDEFPVQRAAKQKTGQQKSGQRKSGKQKARSGDAGSMDLSDGEVFDLDAFQREVERRKLNVTEFRGAIRAGGFKVVYVVAQGPEFVIQGEPQGTPVKGTLGIPEEARMTLVTLTDRTNHRFPNPTSALGMLKRMGVKSVVVEIESWRPDLPTQRERRRPDMVERLKFAHEYGRAGAGQ
jgi:hypothetical protein